MKKLLLISNSSQPGKAFLEHVRSDILDFLGSTKKVLFIPYAIHDYDAYEEKVVSGYGNFGVNVTSIHREKDPVQAVMNAEALFIGGGNTFRLLNSLYKHNLLDTIRERVGDGMPYIGSSAGSVVACPTIKTTNDMPIVFPPSFDALHLIPFQINAHYIDKKPGDTHMGESREERLLQFHEENDTPVIGLSEGGWLRVADDTMQLGGVETAFMKYFIPGKEAQEYKPPTDTSFALHK